METVRVDLPDGNTAEMYAEMKHKTQRAVEEATRQYLTYPEGAGKLRVTQGEDGKGAVRTKAAVEELEVTVDLDRIDHFDAAVDQIGQHPADRAAAMHDHLGIGVCVDGLDETGVVRLHRGAVELGAQQRLRLDAQVISE